MAGWYLDPVVQPPPTVYRAEPLGIDANTRCRKVHERVWQDGQLVRDQIKEVCTSESYQPGY